MVTASLTRHHGNARGTRAFHVTEGVRVRSILQNGVRVRSILQNGVRVRSILQNGVRVRSMFLNSGWREPLFDHRLDVGYHCRLLQEIIHPY